MKQNYLSCKLLFERRPTKATSVATIYEITNLLVDKTENKHLAPSGKKIRELCFYVLVLYL